jgi:signal transduction histidine kinase
MRIQQATHNLETQPMIEEKIVRLDGTLADVLVSAIPFIDDQGPLLFVILLDITSRKQAETALQNSQRKQRELSNHLTLVREEERAHIARELHDELGSFLNILKLDVSWLNNQLPSSLTACREKTQIMLEHINESIENVKKIITDLRPSILDHLGLFPAIEWQVENLCKSTGIHCQLSLPEHDFPIDNIRCTAIFRIAQETLTNIIVHSKASKVIFNITINSDELLMTIIDNGTGMTTAQQTNSGYGILGMHERALHLGGELSIISSLETGTTVVLRMPIQDIRR